MRLAFKKSATGLTACVAVLMFAAVPPSPSQQANDPGGQPSVVIANDRIELTVLTTGGTLTKLQLRDGDPINPLQGLGHFLALDGFGAPSPEESAEGMPFHGEARRQRFKTLPKPADAAEHSLTIQASFPLAQETFTRTMEMVDGENIVYVSSELESALSIDRPISWAEHGTIAPPFLEPDHVVVDMPGINCRVRTQQSPRMPVRLIFDSDFRWPMAPTRDGGQADMRLIPEGTTSLDLVTCQMDPARTLGFVTALHLEKKLLLGYLFRREEYPWVMSWMNYTGTDRAARGMEFSTQPFDISHQQAVALNPLFGTPTFRWLPAKSTFSTRFILFYTTVPEGFSRVDDVTLEGGKLTIEDRTADRRVVLAASRGL